MRRVMIVPAAGAGSRLHSPLPKALAPVNGRPMIDHVFDRHGPLVDRFVLVVNPSAESAIRRHCAWRGVAVDIEIQSEPTGMLDAILIPAERVRRLGADNVWITWCDQVAIHPDTVRTLALVSEGPPRPAMVLPTVTREEPYIHFSRDEDGRIIHVLQRREGDVMPVVGEGDLGLFSLSTTAYLEDLAEFSATAIAGANTRERNFLPFIAWLNQRAEVRTFRARHQMESVGINTPAELALVEAYLRREAYGGVSPA